MAKQTIYTVGGTVQAGGGIYIKRKADDELLELCRQGEFAFILSSRQVGKSSLMVRTAQQLEKEDICSITVDLSAIGVNVSQDEWYLGILNEIHTTLNLKTDIFTWWSQYAQLGPAQRLTNFFKDVLLKEVTQPIVLFFDEIDTTLSIPFSDDFYVALRAVYNARSTTPDFKRLSFVLVGVAAPSDLISDNKRTPFNIGRRVEISDFTLAEAFPLAQGLGEQAVRVLTWVFEYTSGHPYLTQRLCAYLAASNDPSDEQAVAEAVEQLFTGEQGKQDNNLQFVRDMLSKRSPDAARVLLIYRDIRSGKKVRDDERSIAKAHLKLSGLVRSDQGVLHVRNQIYNTVFNLHWVRENTPKNWAKITAYSLGFVTFILLSIFIYDFIISNLSSQYVDKFYRAQAASDKLEYLAKMFELEGILPNADYDSRARDLFFSLSATEQEALFKDSSPIAKSQYLATVVRGLYVTMANVEGGQDGTALLQIMKNSISNVDTNLYIEIDLWLQARNAASNPEALAKYDNAIELNEDNPATHYERAAIEIKEKLFEEALQDLDRTMALANTLSTEAAEREMPTPLSLPTVSSTANVSTTLTPRTPIETPQSVVTTAVPTRVTEEVGPTAAPSPSLTGIPTEPSTVVGTPDVQSTLTLLEPYRSSFFSRAYIRSAIDILIQNNMQNPEFKIALSEAANYPNLNGNGLLPSVATGVSPSQLVGTPFVGPSTSTAILVAQSGLNVYFTDPLTINDPNNFSNSVEQKLIDQINAAQISIHIAVFEFDLTPIAEALIAAKERGVDVRWVTDNESGLEADTEPGRGQFAMLQNAGIEVRADSRTALMHNKFLIFDNQTVWTGSTGITVSGIFKQNNNAVVVHSSEIATIYEREFAEMWDGQYGPQSPSAADSQSVVVDGTAIQVYFSPEDDVMNRIIPIVQSAESNIRFLAFSFTDQPLAQTIIDRSVSGVNVAGVFEKVGSETESSELLSMYCAKLLVRQDGNPSFLEDKVIVVDNRYVITGSPNFSSNAMENNDENVIIIDNPDIAALYIQEFERIWSIATEPDPAQLSCQ